MTSWLPKILLYLRFAVSFLALGGAVTALGWLGLRLETVPEVHLPSWDEAGTPLVVVDAGHGGHDGGAVANGLIEKNLSLTLARQLRDHLAAAGLRVRMTRESDRFLELEERCQIATEAKADLFVSLHLNTSAAAEVKGIETYYCAGQSLIRRAAVAERSAKITAQSERLASVIQRRVCAHAKAEDRGIKDSQLIVVRHTTCPAALVECGFLTHADEAQRLKSADYQAELTRGISAGVVEFLRGWVR